MLLLRRPHTWQNLQRLQHQFSSLSFTGRSSGERQKLWKGSQQIWQNIIWWKWERQIKTNLALKILLLAITLGLGIKDECLFQLQLRADVPHVVLYWHRGDRQVVVLWGQTWGRWGRPLATHFVQHSPPGGIKARQTKQKWSVSSLVFWGSVSLLT